MAGPLPWVSIYLISDPGKFLFGRKNFENSLGLYMFPRISEKMEIRKGFRIETLLLDNKLEGLGANISGMKFILTMADTSRAFNQNHPDAKYLLYHPRALSLDQNNERIRILWP